MKFGITVKDKITGFKGITTGKASYITGCDKILVQPPVSSDGAYVEGQWIDAGRLEHVTDGVTIEMGEVAVTDNGSDINPPK
jgi:hypothetical protein